MVGPVSRSIFYHNFGRAKRKVGVPRMNISRIQRQSEEYVFKQERKKARASLFKTQSSPALIASPPQQEIKTGIIAIGLIFAHSQTSNQALAHRHIVSKPASEVHSIMWIPFLSHNIGSDMNTLHKLMEIFTNQT